MVAGVDCCKDFYGYVQTHPRPPQVAKVCHLVIIGCATALADILRRRFGTPDILYDSRGYVKGWDDDIQMMNLDGERVNQAKYKVARLWNNTDGS